MNRSRWKTALFYGLLTLAWPLGAGESRGGTVEFDTTSIADTHDKRQFDWLRAKVQGYETVGKGTGFSRIEALVDAFSSLSERLDTYYRTSTNLKTTKPGEEDNKDTLQTIALSSRRCFLGSLGCRTVMRLSHDSVRDAFSSRKILELCRDSAICEIVLTFEEAPDTSSCRLSYRGPRLRLQEILNELARHDIEVDFLWQSDLWAARMRVSDTAVVTFNSNLSTSPGSCWSAWCRAATDKVLEDLEEVISKYETSGRSGK